MPSRAPVLLLMVIVLGSLQAACAIDIGDRRPGVSFDDKHAQTAQSPILVRGPTFLRDQFGPGVDFDEDGRTDTYAPSDIVQIAVGFSEQVCGFGTLKLALQTGDGPTNIRNAKNCGCSPDTVFFCYRVEPGDRDEDGLSIPADAISLMTYDGTVPDSRHLPLPSQGGHRVDGNLPDTTSPRLSYAPGIHDGPAIGDVYRRGEKIQITAQFTEDVIVDSSGGLPTLRLQVGHVLRHAVYVDQRPNVERVPMTFLDDAHLLHFEYEVRRGDRDSDGTVWVPANGLEIPAGSSIRDIAGNDASLTWSVSSGRPAYIDGG